MRSLRKLAPVLDNQILVGTLTILIVAVAIYLSYIAENGLPFIPTYNINVDVSNSAELVKNADVRIGGARVGQVLTITPEPATKAWPHPFARLGIALDRNLEPLPPDTRYQVRLASVLGGKYLELFPGTSKAPGLPDGGTFTLDTNPRLNHNLPFVDIDTALHTFGPTTQRGLRGAIAGFGDAVAGRGTGFNDTVSSLRGLFGQAQSLLGALADPSTHLERLIDGLAGTTAALAPIAPTVTSLLTNAATTFAALDRPALAHTIDQAPATEALATGVLIRARPVLADAAAIVQALKPGGALLSSAARHLDLLVTSAPPVFARAPALASELGTALSAVDKLARDPASRQTFQVLGSSDLATFGSSALVGLGAILRAVAPAQFACNVAGLWLHNFASSLSEGDSTAPWLRFAPLIEPPQMLPASRPAADLHLDYYPKENASECQAGNEVYKSGQVIGDPGQTSTVVDNTTPPRGVLEHGAQAGLVP